jgi:hypothetical protein
MTSGTYQRGIQDRSRKYIQDRFPGSGGVLAAGRFSLMCYVFVLFVFVLGPMPNVACVSGISILHRPFGFL